MTDDLLDTTLEAVRRIAYADAYPAALETAGRMTRTELEHASAGESSNTLTDATADACYGSTRLHGWVSAHGTARKIRHLFDLTDAFEESGLDQDTTLSRVRVADLVDLIIWEIEHGPGHISMAWDRARHDAEVAAAREILRDMKA